MALTISTHPTEVITNAPAFTVTTSLTEDASHQNLRIRATIYLGGQTAALVPLEQPKGLSDWDLFDILKDYTGKCNAAVGGSTKWIRPTFGSELLTAWSNYNGQFETFTVSGRQITTAVDSNASGGLALTNDLGSGVAGDIYVFGCENGYSDSDTADFYLRLVQAGLGVIHSTNQYAGFDGSDKLKANHIYFGMLHAVETAPAWVLGSASGTNGAVAGTFTVHKISDFKNNPGVFFHVKFEEVYENGSDVTTIGDEEWSDCLLFIPAHVRPGEAFSDFLDTKALSRLSSADILYRYGIGMEMRVLFACTSPYMRVSYVVDAGTESENNIPNPGWGMLIIADGTCSVDAEDETIGITIASIVNGGGIIYSFTSFNINTELTLYPDMKALSFVGDLGEETLIFRGLEGKRGTAEKTFTQKANRQRKVQRAYRLVRHILRTLYETLGTRQLLHELDYTEKDVWLYDSTETAGYKDVTVISDGTPIVQEDDLIESEVELEYYE